MKTQKTEIKISGHMTTKYAKLQKKYLQSIKIPTGNDFFTQTTVWVPDTPQFNKAPLICLTFNNFKDKVQILFPSALDLHVFAETFFKFIDSQLHDLNKAHMESLADFHSFQELILKHADEKAKQAGENEFIDQKLKQDESNL
jgi:hypothetical protein